MPLTKSPLSESISSTERATGSILVDSPRTVDISLRGESLRLPDAQAREQLARLADSVRRRRKGAATDDAGECTVVAVKPLTPDGRPTGKSFLARALFVSSTGLVLLFDRPAPATAFEIEWEGAGPMTFELVRGRRTRGRYEAALALKPETTLEMVPVAVPDAHEIPS